jgi:hypothetical protein
MYGAGPMYGATYGANRVRACSSVSERVSGRKKTLENQGFRCL